MCPPPPRSPPFPYTTLFRSVIHPAHRVVVVLRGVVGERLDQHATAIRLQRVPRVPGRADRVGHVVQAVEERDQVELLDRKSTRLNSSHPSISYAVFCLKKKK